MQRLHKLLEGGAREDDQVSAQLMRQVRRTRAVVGVVTLALASRIMQQGEELHHSGVGPGARGQVEPDAPHPGPVTRAVSASPIEREPLAQAREQSTSVQVRQFQAAEHK